MNFILEIIAERQSELANLPQSVKIWIKFMRIWFFSGIIFVPWWKPARWIVLTMVATAVVIILSKILLPDFDTVLAGTIIQLTLWIPLAIYLVKIIKNETVIAIKSSAIYPKLFGAWLAGSTLLVLISTALNVMNILTWIF